MVLKTKTTRILLGLVAGLILFAAISLLSYLKSPNDQLLPINNDFVVSRVIINPTSYSKPTKDRDLLVARGANQNTLLGRHEADIGILVSSHYQCSAEAVSIREYEGSILGSFGINKAVTYFLPQLETSKCVREDFEKQYKILVKWGRRSDTDWTILVPGFSNTRNYIPAFKMFTAKINKNSKFDQQKADELASYKQEFKLDKLNSIGNNPNIFTSSSPKFSYDTQSHSIKVRFEYENSCILDLDVETQSWISTNNHSYLWLNPRPGKSKNFCPFDSLAAVKRTKEFSVPVPIGVSGATVLIPNYRKIFGLPLYFKTVSIKNNS